MGSLKNKALSLLLLPVTLKVLRSIADNTQNKIDDKVVDLLEEILSFNIKK